MASAGSAEGWQKKLFPEETGKTRVVMPLLDAERGRRLFVVKGCVICHAVNGVGGKAGPALGVAESPVAFNPLDFAARMWRGADAMLQLQAMELGDFITLSGDDIGDLSTFMADAKLQRDFSIDEVPEILRDLILDERYWDREGWPEDWGKSLKD
jgi:cytochrome c